MEFKVKSKIDRTDPLEVTCIMCVNQSLRAKMRYNKATRYYGECLDVLQKCDAIIRRSITAVGAPMRCDITAVGFQERGATAGKRRVRMEGNPQRIEVF